MHFLLQDTVCKEEHWKSSLWSPTKFTYPQDEHSTNVQVIFLLFKIFEKLHLFSLHNIYTTFYLTISSGSSVNFTELESITVR